MFSTAARAAEVAMNPAMPLCGDAVIVITRPLRCGMNARLAASLVIDQVPNKFSSTTVRSPLTETSSAGPKNCPPALL